MPTVLGAGTTTGAVVRAATAHPVGEAHELLFTTAGTRVWIPEFTGTRLVLDEFDGSGALVRRIDLGPSQASAVVSDVRIAPDDAIWVSSDYTLFRCDASTGTVRAVRLGVRDPDATTDATSGATPSPGTWISGFGFNDAGELVVARNNVPVLEIMTASGRRLRTAPIDEAMKREVTPAHLAGVFPLAHGERIRTDMAGVAALVNAAGAARGIRLASRNVEIANPLGKPTAVTVRERITGAATGPDGRIWVLLAAIGGGTDVAVLPR